MKHDMVRLTNLAKINVNYRRVIDTGLSQSVVMHLIPGEDIPSEIHEDNVQLLYVVEGRAHLEVDGREYQLASDEFISIPMGVSHYVANRGRYPLKLISIYTPPEHDSKRIDYRKP